MSTPKGKHDYVVKWLNSSMVTWLKSPPKRGRRALPHRISFGKCKIAKSLGGYLRVFAATALATKGWALALLAILQKRGEAVSRNYFYDQEIRKFKSVRRREESFGGRIAVPPYSGKFRLIRLIPPFYSAIVKSTMADEMADEGRGGASGRAAGPPLPGIARLCPPLPAFLWGGTFLSRPDGSDPQTNSSRTVSRIFTPAQKLRCTRHNCLAN
jgi:hypothetical protein